MSVPGFTVLPDPRAVAEATADRILAAAQAAIEQRGCFCVALSGGSTPRAVYPLLTAPPRVERVDWSHVEFFWGDERSVPPDDPESNFGVAYRMLVSRLPGVRPEAVHRMPADAPDRDAAARAYEREIARAVPAEEALPAFDLIWLGMGADGHTASLFPGSEALGVYDRSVVPNWAPSLSTWRMTFTFPLIDAAREVLFVVTGGDKAAAVRAVRSGESDLPAARVQAAAVEWLLDRAAAGEAEGAAER